MLRLLNEPTFVQNIGDRDVRTLEQARDYLRKGPLESYERHGFGLYLAQLRSDGAAIGLCGLVKREGLPDVDVGFALFPEYCRKGYAAEAAGEVLRHAGERLGLQRVIAIVSPGNDASIRLLHKLGFMYERHITLAADTAEVMLFGPAPRTES